jgi:tetratricopeptide (TPR) repeat protein
MNRLARSVLLLLAFSAAVEAQYVGTKACQACHSGRFETQSKTGHARALATAASGSPGEWVFGAGTKAITYVSRVDRDWYVEHGLSYYTATKSMAPTPGHSGEADMRYRTFDPEASVLRCFRCHSTGEVKWGAGQSVEPSEPGVHCESCHGPGGAHIRASGAPGTIRNPKNLNAVELNDYCGSCHRKPPEAGEANDWTNSWNTRHQPTYLNNAACFRKSNGKLSCLTCHDPHTPVSLAAAGYDRRCSACHRAVRHRTQVSSRACVDCHMPQVAINTRLRFTNHWIGVYGAGPKLVPLPRGGRRAPPLRLAATPGGQLPPPADPSSLTGVYEQVLAEQESALGPKHARVARSASDLGLFLRGTGDPRSAEAPLRKALQIDVDNMDPLAAADRENLASALAVNGKREEAIELFRQGAAGSDPGVAARCFSSLAMLDEGHADSHYRNALAAEEAASGKEHPRVATVLNNLALALRHKGDNQPAEALFRRALAIQEKALRSNDTAVASTRNNLGNLLATSGRLAEAERLERSALRIFEEKLGAESKETATACNNLADVLWSKGEAAEATRLYRRTVSIDEAIYGNEHPEVAGDLTNLGLLLKETGQWAAAEPLLRRALAIYEKTLGPNSPQALDLRQSLRRAGGK